MNKNSAWKYLALVLIVAFGLIYATPNLYQAEPGIQIIGARNAVVDATILERAKSTLENANVDIKEIRLSGDKIQARLNSEEDQFRARDILKAELKDLYPVALADMPTTPNWLQSMGAAPMYLGLDLRGGVHFLMQVDMQAAEKKANDDYFEDIRKKLREEGLRLSGITQLDNGAIVVRFKTEELSEQARQLLVREYPELDSSIKQSSGGFVLTSQLSETGVAEIRKAALRKNMLALRNRIDQLGVSVHLVDEDNQASTVRGRVPTGSKRFYFRDGTPILLKTRVLYSGDNIIDASSGFDSQTGGPTVNITLDAKGATINSDVTGDNINNRMAVVYVETLADTTFDESGEAIIKTREVKEVITAPVIRVQIGKSYQITGLGSSKEASDIALLLRAGSLAAPVYIIEERTVGPSLGAENIAKGFKSVLYGFLAVLVFMVVYYRLFGSVASFALMLNLVLIVGVLSLLQATLTLPGVAGLVLTVGMAVDANVLIFERIREEIRNGAPPQSAIHQGYGNAFSTIFDANLTTLIAAFVLFNFGTGPIQGFAITLCIGILTSMLTAIFISRIIVNAFYGNRRLESLAI